MMMYKDLADAALLTGDKRYGKGTTEVWYWKEEFAKDMMMGHKWVSEHGTMPDPKNLEATHVLIGKVDEKDREQIWKMMQGDFWSPNGEANAIIRRSGSGHTSMSVGDIIKIGGQVWMVDMMGYAKLGSLTQRVADRYLARQP